MIARKQLHRKDLESPGEQKSCTEVSSVSWLRRPSTDWAVPASVQPAGEGWASFLSVWLL